MDSNIKSSAGAMFLLLFLLHLFKTRLPTFVCHQGVGNMDHHSVLPSEGVGVEKTALIKAKMATKFLLNENHVWILEGGVSDNLEKRRRHDWVVGRVDENCRHLDVVQMVPAAHGVVEI